MSARDIVLAGGGSGGVPIYVDDVFSTYVYTGTAATQTITNGIDLAGKGGLIWIKDRSRVANHKLITTDLGVATTLATNLTAAGSGESTLPTLLSTGFSLPGYVLANESAITYASWTFRKQPKFFDVVTYTGTGTFDKTTPHNLGSVPGMIIVKCTSAIGSWWCYHNSLTASFASILLNSTASQSSSAGAPSAVLGDINNIYTHQNTNPTAYPYWNLNALGATYVAYIFAHNAGGFGTSGSENAISCGSFTTDAGGGANVTLGFEPQWVMCKTMSVAGNWTIFDSIRGMTAASSNDASLYANLTNTEVLGATAKIRPNATGMNPLMAANTAYIYVAIRRPHKPPTLGTQVYTSIARSGTSVAGTSTSFGNVVDLVFTKPRNISYSYIWSDRLRGATKEFYSASTAVEAVVTNDVTGFDSMTGFKFGAGTYLNSSGTYIDNLFKRAPKFFDIVCWTGDSATNLRPHSLGVKPELLIMKQRNVGSNLETAVLTSTTDYALKLNLTDAAASGATNTLSVGTNSSVFSATLYSLFYTAGYNYVAYLFASLAGVSKVSSYTGNGTSQTIACGFTTGARFILIKCTSAVGDWYVWNSATGIIAGNDPHLSLNTTVAEVTSDDSVDPDTSGFIVNQVAATNINVNLATYIFLAIS